MTHVKQDVRYVFLHPAWRAAWCWDKVLAVMEDRGVFAGKRIVRVHVGDWDDAEAPEFELPVDELEPVPAAA